MGDEKMSRWSVPLVTASELLYGTSQNKDLIHVAVSLCPNRPIPPDIECQITIYCLGYFTTSLFFCKNSYFIKQI